MEETIKEDIIKWTRMIFSSICAFIFPEIAVLILLPMHRDQEMTRYYEYMRPRYTNPT